MSRSRARRFRHCDEAQFIATAHVTPRQFLGFHLVAPRDGSDDRLVFSQRLPDSTGRGKGGSAKQHDGVMQVLQALEQKTIVGGAIDMLVEDGVFPGVNPRIVRQLTVQIQHRLEHVDFCRVGESGGECRCCPFQTLTHIVELGDRSQIVLRNRKAATRRVDQHAVGLQATQRLANRRAADLEPGAQLEFENALAGLELAFLDRIANGPIGMLGQPAGCPRRGETRPGQKRVVLSGDGCGNGSLQGIGSRVAGPRFSNRIIVYTTICKGKMAASHRFGGTSPVEDAVSQQVGVRGNDRDQHS
jgi:hypothetical protein